MKNHKRLFVIAVFVFVWMILAYFFYQSYLQEKNHYSLAVNDFNQHEVQGEQNVFEKELSHFDSKTKEETSRNEYKKYTHDEEPGKSDFFQDKEDTICGNFSCFSAEEFIQAYNDFEKQSGLNYRDVFVYDGGAADKHLREIAERRAYRQRVFAHKEEIIPFGSLFTRQEVKDSFRRMQEAMKSEGVSLHFVSGYRSVEKQKEIFKNKMGTVDISQIPKGAYDEKINEVLNRSALPGYSKHHSGYAVDFGCGVDYLVYDFATTSCYDWLAQNNFERAKEFGFIPSYPNAIIAQGPDPEPWEFVWVGRDFIEHYFDEKGKSLNTN